MSLGTGTRRGFACVGCWTADRIKHVDAWPAEETLATIRRIDRHGGGSAHNFGHDVRRLDPGMPVAAFGLLGRDPDGDFLFDGARAAGMDVSGLLRDGALRTSFTDVVTVRGTGRRTFFHHPGTNDALAPDDVDLSGTNARVLHLGLVGLHARLDAPWEGEPNGWVAILKAARALGMATNLELVSIEPERQRSLCLPTLPLLDTLIVNDHEIGSLAGLDTLPGGATDAGACERAARRTLELGVRELVVVHWPGGAVGVARDGTTVRLPSLRVDPASIAGAVGAGDAFAAGTWLALHEGEPLEAAIGLGHRTAAASLRSADAVGGVGPADGLQRP